MVMKLKGSQVLLYTCLFIVLHIQDLLATHCTDALLVGTTCSYITVIN